MRTKACVVTVAVLAVWLIKRYYTEAGADDLWWILDPTARLVGVMTGATFVVTPGEGYFSEERLFLIEKSCAGINFLAAAFGMLVCARLHRVESVNAGLRVLGGGLLASYAAAVVVNASRIAIAMWLASQPVAPLALSPGRIHRLEGVVVYFGGLLLLYECARYLDRRCAPARRAS